MRKAAGGYRATLLTQFARILCKVVSVVVLARMVSPEEHGRFAMAATVFGLLSLFRDLGLGTATVQAPELSAVQSTALCWANIALGVVLCGATFAAAPLSAAFYGAPIEPLVRTMGLAFVILGAGGFVRPKLYRELQFERTNAIETASVVIGTAVMIFVGVAGGGAYAFVAFLLVSELVFTVLAWYAQPWRPAGLPRLASLRELLRTGGAVTFHNAVGFLLQQLDTIAIGRSFGAQPLGVYNRASQLIALPHLYVAAPLGQVLLASLSRVSVDRSLSRQISAPVNGIAHFVLPLFAVPIVLPEETVRLVLGTQWPDAAPLVRVLAAGGFAAAVSSLAYAVAVALGRAGRLVPIGIATVPVIALAIWIGLPLGVLGIAGGIAMANVLLLIPRTWWLLRGLGVAAFCRALLGPFASMVVMAIGLWTAASLIDNGAHWALRLATGLAGGIGALLAAALLSPALRSEWRAACGLVPGRLLVFRSEN